MANLGDDKTADNGTIKELKTIARTRSMSRKVKPDLTLTDDCPPEKGQSISANTTEKHAIDILKADTEDESLQRYKESILGTTDLSKLNISGRTEASMEIISLSIECDDDAIKQTYTKEQMDGKDKTNVIVKEGSVFDIVLECTISGDLLVGLTYTHILKKKAIGGLYAEVDKIGKSESIMIGSFAPLKEVQRLKVKNVEAPSGAFARGQYKVYSTLTDDKGIDQHTWMWRLTFASDWSKS